MLPAQIFWRMALFTITACLASPALPAAAVDAGAEQSAPRHRATHVLKGGRLVAEVMDPNDPERYNRGTRFSPVANVLTASLDGRSFLFSAAAHDPLRENGGLAMEFDLDTPGGPPGFAEAALGEGYVKIGVGVLRKSSERYRFMAPQEIIALADTTVRSAGDRAVFRQTCAGVNGYAYALDAEVRVEAGRIVVSFRLENTGTKPFATDQYAHNYFCFDDAPVGPGYEVEFPEDFTATGLTDGQALAGRMLRFLKPLTKPVNLVISEPASACSRLEVRDVATGQAVVASVSVPAAHTRIHAAARYLCPEQFVRIALAPGESKAWIREYRFSIAGSAP